jgi:signal transduction histidine kinase
VDTADSALLHDIGHEVATLSALVTAVRGQGGLDAAAGERMELVQREVDLLTDLVAHCFASMAPPDEDDDLVDLRDLLQEVVVCRDAASATAVRLRPGPRLVLRTSREGMRRLVINLVDNAVRAAGPSGHVEVDVAAPVRPLVRVLDDGPGPGRGPAGDRGLGLAIVRTLARRLAAEVTLRDREGGGAVAEVVLRDRARASVDPARTEVHA